MLTMDEARGIAARIWTRTNNKRKLMDVQLCEDFADVLVDEVTKATVDGTATPKLKELQDENEKLKTEILNLRAASEKAELQVQLVKEQADKDQKTWQAVFDKIQNEHKALTLTHANLQSNHESLKLKVKPDEVV